MCVFPAGSSGRKLEEAMAVSATVPGVLFLLGILAVDLTIDLGGNSGENLMHLLLLGVLTAYTELPEICQDAFHEHIPITSVTCLRES